MSARSIIEPVPVSTVTPKDIIEFLEDNNCYDVVFPKWTRMDLLRAVSEASVNGTLAFTVEGNKVTGVCIARNCPGKVMHIIGIIVTSKTSMANMLIHFRTNFPLHTLSGKRNGRIVNFDEDDLESLYQHFRKQALKTV